MTLLAGLIIGFCVGGIFGLICTMRIKNTGNRCFKCLKHLEGGKG